MHKSNMEAGSPPLIRGFSGGAAHHGSIPVGSASSNISAPLNGSFRKSFGFHGYFAQSYHSQFHSPEKRNDAMPRHVPHLEESPPTHKQKQLQEFTINLKQNKIK